MPLKQLCPEKNLETHSELVLLVYPLLFYQLPFQDLQYSIYFVFICIIDHWIRN